MLQTLSADTYNNHTVIFFLKSIQNQYISLFAEQFFEDRSALSPDKKLKDP